MADDEGQRKLAAILSADVAGYSRLMADDERATVRTLTDYRAVFAEHVAAHGRIVDTAGDSVLAVFDSVVEAVDCAIAVQRALAERNAALAEHRRMLFRIGVNLGDIIIRDDGTIYGDGVNVAARLEALAAPGGVTISRSAHEQVEGKLAVPLADAGAHAVKNIPRPVHAYHVLLDGTAPRSRSRPALVAGLAAALVIVAGLATWQLTLPAGEGPAPDPILAMPTGPSIAVLPFVNQSEDASQDYFADGVTDDIITRLSWFSDLRVIARGSTFAYKGKNIDAGILARELKADYVLEGGIRREGDDLRVTTRLFDAQAGTNIWADSFDISLDSASLFQVQDTLTEAVVSTIAGQHGIIARKRTAEASSTRPEQLSSYECVLLAHAFERDFTEASHQRAMDCLEAVVETEPNYVDALAALSYIYSNQHSDGLNAESLDYDPLEKAYAVATRAVELEPRNSNAQRHLAMIYFHRREIPLFRQHAMRAIELNPNDPTTLGYLGIYLTWSGDMERGIPLVRKATKLNPDIPLWFYQVFAWEHYMKGEYAEGLEVIETHYGGAGYWDYIWQLFFLGHLGRHEEAADIYRKLDEVRPDFNIVEYKREAIEIWNVPEDWVEILSEALRASGVPEGTPSE